MYRFLAAMLLLAFGSTRCLAQSSPALALDALCQDALRHWQVPGLALVIVKDDRLFYLKGYGVKKLGSTEAVGPDTLFPLASCTKPFTSLALATLDDDSKLHWD